MKKAYRALLFALYFLVLGIDWLFIFNNAQDYRIYTKPLLMPILYVLLAVETVDTTHKKSKLFISMALLFCFVGDIMLLNASENFYFVTGLACFLAAHIWYIIFFQHLRPFSKKKISAIGVAGLLVICYDYLLLNFLWDNLTEAGFELPVVVYCVVISIMLLSAVNTSTGKRIKKVGIQNFVPGAILFVASDTVLAFDKFAVIPFIKESPAQSHMLSSSIIMFSYAFAQLFIVAGAIRIIKR